MSTSLRYIWFFFITSPELKAKFKWGFLIQCRSSSVRSSFCKLFTFSSSTPEPLDQFQPILVQSILEWRGFTFVQMKGHALPKGEIIKKNWQLLKICFYRTSGPISTKLRTKYSWVKGIHVCLDEGRVTLYPKGR